jgi:hypothetical protein
MAASIAGRDGLGMTTMSSTATSPRPGSVLGALAVVAIGRSDDR